MMVNSVSDQCCELPILNNSLHQPIFSLIDLSQSNKSEAKMLTKGIIANKMCLQELVENT